MPASPRSWRSLLPIVRSSFLSFSSLHLARPYLSTLATYLFPPAQAFPFSPPALSLLLFALAQHAHALVFPCPVVFPPFLFFPVVTCSHHASFRRPCVSLSPPPTSRRGRLFFFSPVFLLRPPIASSFCSPHTPPPFCARLRMRLSGPPHPLIPFSCRRRRRHLRSSRAAPVSFVFSQAMQTASAARSAATRRAAVCIVCAHVFFICWFFLSFFFFLLVLVTRVLTRFPAKHFSWKLRHRFFFADALSFHIPVAPSLPPLSNGSCVSVPFTFPTPPGDAVLASSVVAFNCRSCLLSPPRRFPSSLHSRPAPFFSSSPFSSLPPLPFVFYSISFISSAVLVHLVLFHVFIRRFISTQSSFSRFFLVPLRSCRPIAAPSQRAIPTCRRSPPGIISPGVRERRFGSSRLFPPKRRLGFSRFPFANATLDLLSSRLRTPRACVALCTRLWTIDRSNSRRSAVRFTLFPFSRPQLVVGYLWRPRSQDTHLIQRNATSPARRAAAAPAFTAPQPHPFFLFPFTPSRSRYA